MELANDEVLIVAGVANNSLAVAFTRHVVGLVRVIEADDQQLVRVNWIVEFGPLCRTTSVDRVEVVACRAEVRESVRVLLLQ